MIVIGSGLNTHFGDLWKMASVGVTSKIHVGNLNQRVQETLQSILNQMEGGEAVRVFNFFNTQMRTTKHPPTVPTKVRWINRRHHRICYQFDGRYLGHLKNPPPQDIELFLREPLGVQAVQLGKHLSIEESIEYAANSDCFVGVDSGMAQLCYSVGVPVYLVRYNQLQNMIDYWHGSRPKKILQTLPEFIGLWSQLVRSF